MCIATVYGVEHQPSANSATYPFTMSLTASFADCRTLLYMESSAGAKTRGMYMRVSYITHSSYCIDFGIQLGHIL